MTRNQFHATMCLLFAVVCGLLAVTWGADAPAPTLATLSYPALSLKTERDVTATNIAAICQAADFQRTGRDPGPLSSLFAMNAAAERRYTSARHGHGVFVGMEIGRLDGVCPKSVGPATWQLRNTAAMKTAAAQYKLADVPHLTLADIPTPDAALTLLQADPTAKVLIGSHSFDNVAILGATNGLLIVFDPHGAVVALRTPAEMRAVWNAATVDTAIVVFGRAAP